MKAYSSYEEMVEDIGEQSGEFVWEYLIPKISTCEEFLKRVGECDMCVHHSRAIEECENNCEFQVRYE